MVDTVTTVPNVNDDWETAVDAGEFDKNLDQQEKLRTANQEPGISSSVNDDNNQTTSNINLMNLNKPIRILKRPTSQSQLSTNNDVINSSTMTTTSSAAMMNNSNTNNTNLNSSNNLSSSTTVPTFSIIPRNQAKDATNFSQISNVPVFVNSLASSQATKPPIKTYEQRELEYRQARLRIMGAEESSVNDDDDETATTEATSTIVDDLNKATASSISRTTNAKISGLSHQQQQPLQCHSTPGSFASNLYALNNMPPNTGTIHFTPTNNSTPALGTGPFSSPNFPQQYRSPYPGPYSHMPTPSSATRYPLPATTATTLYMTSTAPFVTAPSSSTLSASSYHYSSQHHSNMSTNNWYHYPTQQTPYGAQQYGHPQ